MTHRVRIGEGVQAEVFLQEDGSVVKLWRSPTGQTAVGREAQALRALEEHPGLAPALLAEVELDGRPGLVMQRVEGGGLADDLRSRPWAVGSIARALAECHVRIHAIRAPGDLPSLQEDLRQKLAAADALSPALRGFVLEVLEGLPEGDRICHGDFHIANVLGDADRLCVIDWPNAARGDPDADVAHTNILHRFGRPRDGTGRLDRAAVTIGRRVFAARYLAAYRSLRPLDQPRFERWEIVRAAARLGAGVPGETDALLRFLEHRRAAHGRGR